MTDSRSSIEYVKNWHKIMASTGLDIISKLARPESWPISTEKEMQGSSDGRGVLGRLHWAKYFFTCSCCLPAFPAHLLDYWVISLGQLFEDHDLVCDIVMRKGQMDLV
ncbi:hypothetical protein TNCV_73991 [Trichonephila clavipes]|nr:hypothetical protein TNCV_73991 [Trichonephila clavipes]